MNDCDEYLCSFDVNMPFDEFSKRVTSTLGLSCIKTVCSHKEIKTASICTGSGASELVDLKTDCLLTGDIKYHEALEAKENNISLIEIGHYESEVHFGSSLKKELQNYGLSAIIANSKNPFRYIT
jgi:putative NIF3 family GTP cyclohydrolase 1 type 2